MRDMIFRHFVTTDHVRSKANCADLCTKPLPALDQALGAEMNGVRPQKGYEPVGKAGASPHDERMGVERAMRGEMDENGCPVREQLSTAELMARIRSERKRKDEKKKGEAKQPVPERSATDENTLGSRPHPEKGASLYAMWARSARK